MKQLITLLMLVAFVSTAHIYIMNTDNNDFVDLTVSGENLSVIEVSELNAQRNISIYNPSTILKMVFDISCKAPWVQRVRYE